MKLTVELRAKPEKTQELYQTLQALLPSIRKEKGCRVCRVWRGEHSKKDMAGDAAGSWKSVLTAKGFTCEPILRGMAEKPEIVNVWLDHLESVFSSLSFQTSAQRP